MRVQIAHGTTIKDGGRLLTEGGIYDVSEEIGSALIAGGSATGADGKDLREGGPAVIIADQEALRAEIEANAQ